MQRDMEYIRMVYKTGSFSKAAELLFSSQPTVSMAVQRVEEELGAKLFERGTSPLRPTEAGKRYLAHADRIAQSEMQLRHELAELDTLHGEKIRLGCLPMHTQSLIPKFLGRFIADNPDMDISVFSACPEDLYRMLHEGEADLIINKMADTDDIDVDYIPAVKEQLLIAVPPGFPVNDRLKEFSLNASQICTGRHRGEAVPTVPLSAFADVPFIVPTKRSPFYRYYESVFSEPEFQPKACVSISAPILTYSLAKRGLGAALIGSLFIDEDGDPLRYYKPSTRIHERTYFFAVRSGDELTAVQRHIIRAFQTFYDS